MQPPRILHIAFILLWMAVLSGPAPAQPCENRTLLTATFDDKAIDAAIGNGGAAVGEPVSVGAPSIVRAAPFPTPSLELSDNSACCTIGTTFELLDNEELTACTVVIQADLWFSVLEGYAMLVREQGGFAENFVDLVFNSGNILFNDQNTPAGGIIGSYSAGVPHALKLVFDMDAGSYDLWFDGNLLIDDEEHGVVGRGIGRVGFQLLGDADLDGQLYIDNLTVREEATPRIVAIEDVGNDQGRVARVTFERSPLDHVGSASPIDQYEAFRRIDALPATQPVTESLDPSMGSQNSLLLAGWEFVGAIPAHGESQYSMIVPTLADSTSAGTHWSTFFIRAASTDPFVFADSPPDSGYSIDNLAPSVPLGFVVTERRPNDDVVLAWDPSSEPDLGHYSLHRGYDPAFVPSEANRIANLSTEGYVDPGAAAGDIYYKLSAIDFSGNESGFVLASTAGAVDVGATTQPTAFAVYPIEPNPARGPATIRFDLPAEAAVRLTIHDVHGRLVRSLGDQVVLDAGRHRWEWDARDTRGVHVPSGIYFYRVELGGKTRTTRLVMIR